MSYQYYWQEVATNLAGEYVPGDFFVREQIRVPVPPWVIHVEIEPTSLIPMTRLSAECTRRRAFCLQLERSSGGTVVTTSHALFAESLLSLEGYREALLTERFTLTLEPGALSCETYGVVTEPERLVRLIEIVAETLQRLRDLSLIRG
jgi:hypothetical protein